MREDCSGIKAVARRWANNSHHACAKVTQLRVLMSCPRQRLWQVVLGVSSVKQKW